MAKTVASLVGVVFILVGIVGFIPGAHTLLNAHLSPAHNVVHLVSGAVSLYFGTKGTLGAARTFCLIFGIVYGLLGIVGFFAGKPGDFMGMHDTRLLSVLPGTLELGTMDHVIHIVIGLLYLVGALATKAKATES
jgi:hypothetical protein